MNKLLICLILVFMFAAPSFAIAPWIDTWNNGSFYVTNGENKGFNALLARSEIRTGIKFSSKEVGSIPPPMLYLASILTASADKNYWNNNYAVGTGMRIMPFKGYESTGWMDEWIKDVKIYGEVLTLSHLKDFPGFLLLV